ncbi:MAG: DUF2804 domain-containing protein [Microthrixaceae bacterium]
MPARPTHERRLTDPVDLTRHEGSRLNPAAVGWSTRPLHRANLNGRREHGHWRPGRWGRNKRWDYWAVLAGDLVVAVTYADLDYLGLAEVWWCDLAAGREGGADIVSPLGRGIELPDRPGTEPMAVSDTNLTLRLEDSADGTTLISARWTESDGSPAELEAHIRLPDGHESLNVVIPWSERRFQYTSKHQARPASGHLTVAGRSRRLEDSPTGAWGVLDVGRGRWPYSTRWNWGGGGGRVGEGGPVVGLQFGAKWTEGTGLTENGVIIDGRLTKIGAELCWDYRWDDPMRPWTVTDPDGHLSVTLTPRHDKHSRLNLGVLMRETHQVFGNWSGWVADDDGRRVEFDGLQGFAEESRARW